MEQKQSSRIEQLYKQYYKQLVTYAYRYLEDWGAANEAVQETFHDVCLHPERLLSSVQPLAWLKKACRFVCLGMLRKRSIDTATLLSLETMNEKDLSPVYDRALEDALLELSEIVTEEDRELLYRIFVSCEPYESVAQSLGIKVSACYKRTERLREKIRKNKKF